MSFLDEQAIKRLQQAAAEPDLSGTRYELVQLIGVGGMGSVYLVRDRELDREIALKIADVHEEPGLNEIHREARILARLDHPGIVPIYDTGLLRDGRRFYTMKFIEGQTLDHARESASSLCSLLRTFAKACEAVAFAHTKGWLHLDLKPQNVMSGPFGETLVLDWGIARTADDAGQRQKVGGTPGYMAPEQTTGPELGPYTDVYGLGAVLLYLLTGKPPATGSDLGSMKLPPPLVSICKKALAEQPSLRYASVADMADDIYRFIDGERVSSHKERLTERSMRWIRKNRILVSLILAYVLMRIAVALFLGN